MFGNFSWIRSEVLYKQINFKRPIHGQSPYIINAGIQYSGENPSIEVFLSYNRIGPRVAFLDDVSFGLPNTIEESSVYAKIPAFPNPANNVVNINTDKNAASINIYDVTGRMVGTFVAENKKTSQISTSAFDQGIYIYRVLDKSNMLLYT